MDIQSLQIGVVGASLAGLSVANVLKRAGGRVTVFEQGPESFGARGGGLGVSVELVRAVTGRTDEAPPHVIHSRRRLWMNQREWEEPARIRVTAYGALWRWLRESLPPTTVRHHRHVVFVEEQPQGARITTQDSRTEQFDLVIAADGGTSGLRQRVEDPGHERHFAGYVLWRGLVPTEWLDDGRFGLTDRFHVANRGDQHFVAYAIPGHGGEDRGERPLLNWGWYSPLRKEDLPELLGKARLSAPHVLERNEEVHGWFADLERKEGEGWPAWVRHITEQSGLYGAIAPHPVFEILPGKLVSGRVALVGDAAHLASPITGSGASMAMEDALVLGAALSKADSLEEALRTYASARRGPAARIVREGQSLGAAFRAPETPQV